MSEDTMTPESGEAEGGTENPMAQVQGFIAANAEFFAQTLAPINELFSNSGMMNIVSEEDEFTVVVGMRTTDEEGVMDVDCAALDPNQESLKESLNALFA